MRYGPLYTPASVEGTVLYPGTDGGAEWGGAAWDSETGLLFVNANQVPWILQMVRMSEEQSREMGLGQAYLFACSGCHGLDMRGDGVTVPSLIDLDERVGYLDVYRVIRDGRGRMTGMGGMLAWWQTAALAWFVYTAGEEDAPASWAETSDGPMTFVNAGYQKLLDRDQLPGSKPPWGTLAAIDLSAGEIRWQVPLGDYPQVLAAGLRGLGAENYGGPVVTTGGLLFIAATPDARVRAFDKHTGELLWEAELPYAGFATPAVYEADGRQFLVVAAGGGKLETPSGSAYVAFALPAR
jgi:quinoprotein glucose dehydrogenase